MAVTLYYWQVGQLQQIKDRLELAMRYEKPGRVVGEHTLMGEQVLRALKSLRRLITELNYQEGWQRLELANKTRKTQ